MIFMVVLAILVLASLTGNTLVILTVFTNKPLQSTLNYLLVNLAVADMFFAAATGLRFVVMPWISHRDGSVGNFFCTFITGGPTPFVGGAVSVLCLMYISIERYFAIIYPLRQRGRLTRRRLKIFIVLTWFLGILINIPAYVGHDRFYDSDLQRCEKKQKTVWISNVNSLLWFIGAGLTPVGIMVYMYSRVVVRLWFKSTESYEASNQAALRHRKRVTITVIMLSVIYAICWLPDVTMFVVGTWGLSQLTTWFEKASFLLLTFNTCVNPVLYSIQMKRFRDHLCDMLLCRGKQIITEQVLSGTTCHRPATDHTVSHATKVSSSHASKIQPTERILDSTGYNTNIVVERVYLQTAKCERESLEISDAVNTTLVIIHNTHKIIGESKSIEEAVLCIDNAQDNGTSKARVNTAIAKKGEASPTNMTDSRTTSGNPVDGLHEISEFQESSETFNTRF